MNRLNSYYYKIQFTIGAIKFNLNKKKYILPQIYTIEETIDKIINEKCSVSRFGDGELSLLDYKTKAIVFQKADQKLTDRLREVIQSNENNLLICLPESWRSLENYKAKSFHKFHMQLHYNNYIKYFSLDRKYYNAHMTRPFRDFIDKSKAEPRFKMLKLIWTNRDVVLIEGVNSRIGVGTDLFEGAKSFSRILCPTKNAFTNYDGIFNEALKTPKKNLILIALGPTATIMAHDLSKEGYQAIDIGHIGSEYFSFLKYFKNTDFNKSHGANFNFEMYDTKYESEIIAKIL